MNKYIEGFESYENLVDELFGRGLAVPEDFPTEYEILFAWYEQGDYEGSADLFYVQEGKIYENTASHCSCNGFDGQWAPAEVSWPYLRDWLENNESCSQWRRDSLGEELVAYLRARIAQQIGPRVVDVYVFPQAAHGSVMGAYWSMPSAPELKEGVNNG